MVVDISTNLAAFWALISIKFSDISKFDISITNANDVYIDQSVVLVIPGARFNLREIF